jgi:hypothetical protein
LFKSTHAKRPPPSGFVQTGFAAPKLTSGAFGGGMGIYKQESAADAIGKRCGVRL